MSNTALGNIVFRIVDKDGGSFCNTTMFSSSSSCTIPSVFLFGREGASIVPAVVDFVDGASSTVLLIRNRNNDGDDDDPEEKVVGCWFRRTTAGNSTTPVFVFWNANAAGVVVDSRYSTAAMVVVTAIIRVDPDECNNLNMLNCS